ncbi:probable basic-leucine zipper transcription factor R [Galendromus occidentalis]|uniref:Probable basic-leucine zipper transcription factor R n=1 Tax=Galendromus occidentalis TaxID=34638 RepID=A0AAJ7P980_9ACAR|nr:probable basic-leucine zipper transcription factor R [Galendromus occidentalis]
MASGAAGNGTQASLEDMLSTDVDESVVNALKGSLESQLCDDPTQASIGTAQFQPPQQQAQQQQAPQQPLPPQGQQQQQQQTTIVAPAQHFQVATTSAITTSTGAVITTAQQMQTVSAVPVTAGGQQQLSAMHNLANVASQQSPIVVQKPQIHVQVRPESEKQTQPTGLQLVNVQRNIKPAGPRVILSQPIRMATSPQVIRTSHPSQYYRFPVQHHQYPGSQMAAVSQHQHQQQQQQQQHSLYQRNGAYIPHPSSHWSRSNNSSPYNMMPTASSSQQQHQQQTHMNNNRLPMRQNGPSWDDHVVGMPMTSMYNTGGHPVVGSGGGPAAGVRMMGPPPQPHPPPSSPSTMNRMLIRERPPPSAFQGHRREDNITFQQSVQLRPGTLLMRHDQSGQFQLVNMANIGQPRLTIPVSTPAVAKRPGTPQVGDDIFFLGGGCCN